jgi:hypothetical protein
MLSTRSIFIAGATGILAFAASALGWNAHGHRTVTLLALDRLPADAPQWLHAPEIRARIADQSNEPDRWRGTRSIPIGHEANPEHYIDIEDLEPFGLSLHTLPRHRYEAFRAMVLAKHENPRGFAPVEKDPDKSKEWPGFLPWAIQEHFFKLQSSFNTYRILVELDDPARAGQLEQARQNVIYEMGILSHFVGDAAQPLHTTRHHHGWIGDNPKGYTTDFGFHAYIDGRILEIHGLDYAALKPLMPQTAEIPPDFDAWAAGIDHIARSFQQVEALYERQKDGSLIQAPGRAMISERLCDGAATLGTLYAAAWQASKPTQAEISAFIKFSEMRPPRRERQQTPAEAGRP